MLSKFARTHHARVLIQLKCDFCFERQARALENDFGSEFVSHKFSIPDCV